MYRPLRPPAMQKGEIFEWEVRVIMGAYVALIYANV